MKRNFYLPILKAKRGELSALRELADSVKEYVVPILEVTDKKWDSLSGKVPKSIEEHLESLCGSIWKRWPSNNLFIDPYHIQTEVCKGSSVVEYIYDLLFQKNIFPGVIVRIDSPQPIIEGIQTVSLLYGQPEFGLRIQMSDLVDPDLSSNIQRIFTDLDVSAAAVHIIIDLGASDFTDYNQFGESIFEYIEGLPFRDNWKSISVVGGSFPATGDIKQGANMIPRNDWKLFLSLVKNIEKSELGVKVNYGDYSVVAPGHFMFDFRKMSRSANTRYTHDEFWYVQKGKALKESNDFKQYIAQAKNTVANSGLFLGDTYSSGDLHLKQCSEGKTTAGTPETWNKVGNVHHITKVVNDLLANSVLT